MPYEKGLDQDMSPALQPPDTYRYAQNMSLARETGILMSEEGNTLLASLPNGSKLVGKANFPDGSVALFVKGIKDSIYLFEGSTLTLCLEDGSGTFDFGEWVQAVGSLSMKQERILYWVDGVNAPRRVNLDLLTSTSLDVALDLGLFYTFADIPRVKADIQAGGGSLLSGVYRVAVAFVDMEGGVTPYLGISMGQAIYPGPYTDPRATVGAEPGTPTSRSLKITLDHLSSFEGFRGVRLALVHGSEVQILPEQPFSDTLVVSGGESMVPGNLLEVLVAPISYEVAGAIAEDSGRLYLANVKRGEALDYQKFANAITTTWGITTVPGIFKKLEIRPGGWQVTAPDTGYRLGENFSRLRTYKRGETYAFYISLILKDGSETPAYHIPGRAPVGGEEKTPGAGGPSFSSPMDAAAIGATRKFQLEAAMQSGKRLAYWENETEKYPNTPDFDIWTVTPQGNPVASGESLQGQKVRHHQIPNSGPLFLYTQTHNQSNGDGYALGVKFANIRFPKEIKDKIIGYKIYRAYRGPENQRVIDQSPIHRVYTDNNFGITDATQVENSGLAQVPNSSKNSNKMKAAFPFHLLRTHRNTSGISFIRSVGKLGTYGESTFSYGGTQIDGSDPSYRANFQYVALNDLVYVDANAESVGFGTEGKVFFNRYCPEVMVMELERPIVFKDDVVEYCSMIPNQYAPFNSQTLVWTGCVNTDLSNAFTGITTELVYGGDIFLTHHTMVGINASDINPVGSEQGRAYLYLHQQVVESLDLTSLRHEGPLVSEVFFPKENPVEKRIRPNGYEPHVDIVARWTFNHIYYNDEYSSGENLKVAFPYNPSQNNVIAHPNRVVRSSASSQRTFLSEDYKEVGRKRGPIIKLVAMTGNLLIHCVRSLFRTKGNEELAVGDVKAYIGSGDIFGPEPEEIFGTDEGYGGLSHPHSSILSPGGYMFVDVEGRRVFKLADGLKDISTLGLRKYFKSKITSDIVPIIGYDPYLDRIFFTVGDETVSFLSDRNLWESFHSGVPDFYFSTANRMYSSLDEKIYGKGMSTTYYGEEEAMILEVVSNDAPHASKVLVNALLHVQFEKDGTIDWKKLPDSIRITNDHQDTGVIDLIYFNEPGGNARKTGEIWKINTIRDAVPRTLNGHLPEWNRKRMSGTYHTLRVSFKATDGYLMRVFGLELAPRPSYR